MKWFRLAYVVPVVGLLLAAQCSSNPPGLTGPYKGGGPPFTGPCTQNGEVRDCHVVVGQHEGYTDCFNGQQSCIAGTWGPCDGSGGKGGGKHSRHVIPKAPPGGWQTESYSTPGDTTPPCSEDLCNPYCWGFDEVPPAPIAPPPGCVVTAGGCQVPVSWDAYYGDIPGANQSNGPLPTTCTAGPPDNCSFDSHCVAGACAQYADGASGSCTGIDFTIDMPCWNGTNFTFEVCNRGTVAATSGILPIAHNNGSANHQADTCMEATNGPAGDCTLNLSTHPLQPGECYNITPVTDCGGAVPNNSGDQFYQANFSNTGLTPIAGECNTCNNFAATKDTAETLAGALCNATGCGIGGGPTTTCATVSGTVYDPGGNVALSGVNVYQLATGSPAVAAGTCATGLISLTDGVSTASPYSCDTCTNTLSPYTTITTTATDGTFTLPVTAVGGSAAVVIQAGRWRRCISVPAASTCVNTPIPGLTCTGNCQPTLGGHVSVTSGSTAITFSSAQTLTAGTQLIFSSQNTVAYSLSASITAATAGVLTAAYTGATNAAATVIANEAIPAQTRLPATHLEGNIPLMAISMGSLEPFECDFAKWMGCTSTYCPEMGPPSGGTRIQMFHDTGATTSPAAPGSSASLWNSQADLDKYSIIMLPCAGTTGGNSVNAISAATSNLFQTYVEAGGKLFVDHDSVQDMMQSPAPPAATQFNDSATWRAGGTSGTPSLLQARVEGNTPAHTAFVNWLTLNSAYGGGFLPTPDPRQRAIQAATPLTTTNAATAQTFEWLRGCEGCSSTTWTGTGDFSITYSYQLDQAGIVAPNSASACGDVFYNGMHVDTSRGGSGGTFPGECSLPGVAESPNELAFEYLIFALSACSAALPPPVSPPPPPTIGPPPPPLSYTNTYAMSTCPPGSTGQWDEFSYDAVTPNGTTVQFAVQTGPTATGPWSPAAGTPAGVLIATAPTDHPGGDGTGNPSCSMTGPSPCGNNCTPFTAANASGACPASCECPIDIGAPLSTTPLTLATAQEPYLQLNVLLSSTSASCAGALSPGLLATTNGLSGCPGAHDASGTACTTATQYTACDQDFHCDLIATDATYQQCISNLSSVWIDPNCVVGPNLGFDLTIEPGCFSGANLNIPVCNRGGATIPAGQVINITSSTYSSGCGGDACGGPGTADCSYTLTGPLVAGACVDIPPSAGCNLGSGDMCLQVNPGNTVIDVNGNKECETTAGSDAAVWGVNGTGAGCLNNDTYVTNTPAGCEACAAPLSSGSPALNSWNVTYSCVPSE